MEAELSEEGARVQELLERVADGTGLEADVRVREDGDGITGEFVGEDLGLLIGHHGQTIDAIQHLAYRIAFRGISKRASAWWSTRRGTGSDAQRPCEPPLIKRPRRRCTIVGQWPSRRCRRWSGAWSTSI